MLKKLLFTYGFAGLSALLAGCDVSTQYTNDSPIAESPVIEPNNESPTISAVTIVDINGGELAVGDVLEGRYTYFDADGDLEGDSTYQWLRGLDATEQQDGTALRGNFTPIFEAINKTYIVTSEDIDYQLMLEVTPVAQTGELQGDVVAFEPTPTTALDITPPVITLVGDSGISIVQGSTYIELGATTSDNVDADGEASFSGAVDTNTVGSYTVTYIATDAAGNEATEVIRTVNVTAIPDTTAPVITLTGSETITLVQGTSYTEFGATTTDNVDAAGSAAPSGSVDTSEVGRYTITYSATDDAGNAAAVVTRTVNVIAIPDTTVPDITRPVIMLTGANPVEVVQGEVYTELGATTIDNVDANGRATSSGTVDSNTVGSYIITYTAIDAAGNEAVAVTRTVNVTVAPDTIAPVIKLNGANLVEVVQGEAYTELGAITTDNIDAVGSATPSGVVDTDTVGTYTITYTATDAAGNKAVVVTRTVNVTAAPDTELPFISLVGGNPIEVVQGEVYTELGATTTDNVDAAGIATASGEVDTDTVGAYTITYTATDTAGNEAVAVTRTVNVTAAPDTIAPVITLTGANPVEVVQGEAYTELGATTSDNVDADGIATASGTVDTNTVGSYTITYTATDAAGNEAVAVTRTVNVTAVPDTELPIISLVGDNPIQVVQGETYTELGATTTDNVDTGGIATPSGTVDTDTVGSYTITYTATDAAGNEAVAVTRTVNVATAPDTELPVITLTGANPIEVVQGEAYTEIGATTADNVDAAGDATASGKVDTNTVGSYIITYTASDAAGNEAVAVTRTVNVTAAPDTIAPVITLTGANPVEVVQGEAYTELGATTSDNVDVAGSATPSGIVDTDTIGTYTITYTATDAAGNEAVAVTRTVTVTAAPDTELPVISLVGDNPIEVVQGDAYTELGATTADNVDAAGNATPSGTVDTNTVGTYTITYTATDAAGNEAVAVTRTVNVTAVPDTIAPVITLTGANPIEVIQGETYTELGATTTDNVDIDGSATASGTVDTDAIGTYTITYTAADAAGNDAVEVTRTVNVVAQEATLQRAHRLLLQTTFGPTLDDLSYVQTNGITEWIDEQLAKPSAYDSDTDHHRTHFERVIEIAHHAEPEIDWFAGSGAFNHEEFSTSIEKYQMATWWENALGLHPTNTLHGSDQLRQRVAYALSQLLVVSNFEPPLDFRGESLAYYYDILAKHAFGNYRDLLGEMARSPTMGVYLSHQGNQKASIANGTRPDENFARELMQLFTIGLYELNRDGTTNRDGDPTTYPDAGTALVPTYTQDDTEELSKVMTGWDLVGNTNYGDSRKAKGDHTQQMEFTPSMHEDEIEEGGDGLVTLLGQTFALNATDADGNSSGMDAALDVLFNHPNVGPYISKKLIMRLVTSNPSSSYIERVATVFNNDGNGVRGNLKAVVRAILVDIEARSDAQVASGHFGKVKEPLLAWSQFLRAMDVMSLDGWENRHGTSLVSDIYWLRDPEKFFAQGPLRSPSVFNFYSDDYVPSDPAFSSAGLVAPELQIQTDQMLLSYNNQIHSQIYSFEKNELIGEDGTVADLATFAATRRYGNSSLILINFDKELALVKAILDGDLDNIDDTVLRNEVIDALIVHLDQLLLGESMTAEYKAALKEFLVNSNAAKNSKDNFTEVLSIIQHTVRVIVSSNLYTVQK